MARKILIITVGGSCAPIVKAVTEDIYDKIYFVCSTGKRGSEQTIDGPGKPCNGKQAEEPIAIQASLDPGVYEKILLREEEIDDLAACYSRLQNDLARQISGEFLEAHVVANYTGGTKTMSAALVALALAHGWELQLNHGPRSDLVKVRFGDVPVFQSADPLIADRYAILASKALKNWDYSTAAAISEAFLRQCRHAPFLKSTWTRFRALCLGFASWDAFFYEEALDKLSQHGRYVGKWLGTLRTLANKDAGDHAYVIVVDLLRNAQRRADQKRFDDAVSRLYRATELLAQARLQERYGFKSGKIDIGALLQSVSDEFHAEYEQRADDSGVVKLGLHDTYKLLARLNDSLGRLFLEQEKRILDVLRVRNFSFLAHGLEPIDTSKYKKVFNVLAGFISQGLDVACSELKSFEQLPGPQLKEFILE